jgi:NADH:ubiquinone oxidoreductase subunit 2 (subunit N)
MLTQRNMKRLLALSTIEDMGFLLLGVTRPPNSGCAAQSSEPRSTPGQGAALHLHQRPGSRWRSSRTDARGLATRYPVSAAGFLAGMLAMLGIPPLLGFAGRWRLYQTALE